MVAPKNYLNKIYRICRKVWLKSVLLWLKHIIFSRGLFFIDTRCRVYYVSVYSLYWMCVWERERACTRKPLPSLSDESSGNHPLALCCLPQPLADFSGWICVSCFLQLKGHCCRKGILGVKTCAIKLLIPSSYGKKTELSQVHIASSCYTEVMTSM